MLPKIGTKIKIVDEQYLSNNISTMGKVGVVIERDCLTCSDEVKVHFGGANAYYATPKHFIIVASHPVKLDSAENRQKRVAKFIKEKFVMKYGTKVKVTSKEILAQEPQLAGKIGFIDYPDGYTASDEFVVNFEDVDGVNDSFYLKENEFEAVDVL